MVAAMNAKRFALIPLLALFALPLAAAQPNPPTQTKLATVNGVAIPAAALDGALAQARGAGAADTPALRQTLKSQLVARELLRQAADKRGLAKDSEVEAAARQAREAAMIQKYLREAVKPQPVTEAQVRERFDAIVASLGPQEYRLRVIQSAEEAAAQRVLSALKGGASFEDLARARSGAPAARNGGLLDWVSFKTPLQEGHTQGVPLPLAQAALGLKPGAVSVSPIAWNDAWFVVRLEEVRPTRIPAFEQAAPALRQALAQQAIERASAALVAELVKNAKIQ